MKQFSKMWRIFALLAIFAASCGLLQEPEEASGSLDVIPLEEPTEEGFTHLTMVVNMQN